jgi:hypothetical protein
VFDGVTDLGTGVPGKSVEDVVDRADKIVVDDPVTCRIA